MTTARLEDIIKQINGDSLPPVHLWNPSYCGELDIEIRPDGSWTYMGSPIGRARLVRLFSRVLRKEDNGSYVLVTPVEKIGIRVVDAPFLATACERLDGPEGAVLAFTTNVGDRVLAGPDHPIRVEIRDGGEPRPYVHVRAGLEALIARTVFYDLVEWAEEDKGVLSIQSGAARFTLGSVEDGA